MLLAAAKITNIETVSNSQSLGLATGAFFLDSARLI
jgi:hypothetical protein